MKTSPHLPARRYSFIGIPLVTAVLLSGCLQTAPVVVVTPQDQAARLLYNCPNGRTLDVTRVQGNATALVVVDGKTLQLPRDTATTSAERYTNRLQTLTLCHAVIATSCRPPPPAPSHCLAPA